MAHMIYELADGRASMAYMGEPPWHGLGQDVKPGQSMEIWMEEAGLQWHYKEAMVRFTDENETPGLFGMTRVTETDLEYPERKVIYRSDNLEPLSIVGNRYQIVQPKEIVDFYRELVDSMGYEMHTLGSLDEGRKVWALAKVGRDYLLPDNGFNDNDALEIYLLLATSCDRSMATVGHYTTVRVVCNNTLNIAVGPHGYKANIRQTHASEFDPVSMKRNLGINEERMDLLLAELAALRGRKVGDEEAVRYFQRLVGAKDDEDKLRTVGRIYDAYKTGIGHEDTAWGLVNAVTYYLDHMAGRSAATRLNSSWFGVGAAMKKAAFSDALKLAA